MVNKKYSLIIFIVALVLFLSSCLPPPSNDFDPISPPEDPEVPSNNGLLGNYFNSVTGERILQRVDSSISFFWNRTESEPLGINPPDFFSIVWEGYIIVNQSGNYKFNLFLDDGARLFIDEVNILPASAWDIWSQNIESAPVYLETGREYEVRLEFFQYDWNAEIRLNWTRPGMSRSEPIPASALTPLEQSNTLIPYGVPKFHGDIPTNPSVNNTPITDPEEPIAPPADEETQTINYNIDRTTDFINPERGWIMHVGSASQLSNVRSQGLSVVWSTTYEGSLFRLDSFRFSDISQQRLNELDNFFNTARNNGIKVKVRFSYNGNPQPLGQDAPEATIIRHIEQLAPLLQKHEDVIAMMDASFVGAWAEWHSSNFGLTDNTASARAARSRITTALLNALPESRMIGHRYPALLPEIYGEPGYVTESQYFSGNDQSRVGWLNDCFLMGRGNVGTYNTWSNPQPETFDKEKNIFAQMGKYAVASAETCSSGGGLSEYNTCSASIAEMELLSGPDLLNRDYWTPVYDRWRTNGCYDEISTRLGYRFAVTQGVYSTSVNRGSDMYVSLSVQNIGFGKLYNPRPLELVLIRSDGTERRFVLEQDARMAMPLGGETRTITRQVRIPSDMLTGTYQLYLAMPDGSQSLRNDVRYSIRLANTGNMWDSARGINNLEASVQIN